MKKITVLIISFTFVLANSLQVYCAEPSKGSYSFLLAPLRHINEMITYHNPNDFPVKTILKNMVQSTKQDASKSLISGDGKCSLSKSLNGDISTTVGGVTKTYDKFGNLKSIMRTLEGNRQEVRNEFGEITGYNQLDGKGRVVFSYDEDMNKTTYNHYNNNRLEYSLNLMNNQKTVYDDKERAMVVYAADGLIARTYQYKDVNYDTAGDRRTLTIERKDSDERGLVSCKDYNGEQVGSNYNSDEKKLEGVEINMMAYNITYYDDDGLILYVNEHKKSDPEGVTIQTYYYKKDPLGNKVIDYVLDTRYKEKTYYENNRQSYVTNDYGDVKRRYYWKGSKYILSAEIYDGNVTSTTDEDGKRINSNIIYDSERHIYREIRADGSIVDYNEDTIKLVDNIVYKEVDDKDGKKIKVVDYIEHADDNRTYYTYDKETGESRIDRTEDRNGNNVTEYGWDNNALFYSFDTKSEKLTVYASGNGDTDPKVLLEYSDNMINSESFRINGQLIAKYDLIQGSDGSTSYDLTIYVNETEVFVQHFLKDKPTEFLAVFLMNEYIRTGSASTQWLIDKGYFRDDQLPQIYKEENSGSGSSNNS